MSDQANSEKLSGESQQARGHGRRAVMVGAAAVGAGAVAGLAAPAAGALASPNVPALAGAVSPTHSIVVRLPGAPMNIDLTIKTLQSVLSQVGCGGCFSGWDITFTHELEFFVSPSAGVQPGI